MSENEEARERRVLACEPGGYPWDDWKSWALGHGVEQDLADLGRSLMREAFQHGWSEKLKRECGWDDEGEAMLELAVQKPTTARKRWEILLRRDGI